MEVYIDAVTVRLAVDGKPLEQSTDHGTARLLDVSSAHLYIGGVGVSGLAAAVDASLDSLLVDVVTAASNGTELSASTVGSTNGGSLKGGCIRNFKV